MDIRNGGHTPGCHHWDVDGLGQFAGFLDIGSGLHAVAMNVCEVDGVDQDMFSLRIAMLIPDITAALNQVITFCIMNVICTKCVG